MARLPLAAALLLALAARAARGDGEDPKARAQRIAEAKKAEAEADKRFAEAVNAAIDKGAKWLESSQAADGTWLGFQPGSRDKQDLGLEALALLTLVKCGRDPKDPSIQKGLKALRGMYDGQGAPAWNFKATDGLMTYSVAAMVLLYEALYDPAQPAAPGDRYAAPRKKGCRMPKDVEALVRDLVGWLSSRRAERVWRYPDGLADGNEDLSNTQYALLALHAASRCGIEAPARVYEDALAYLLEHQAKTGPEVVRWIPNPSWEPGSDDRYGPFLGGPRDRARGWAYLPASQAFTGSMTTAGIAALAIVKDRLKALERLDKDASRKIDAAMVDGIAWLSKEFTVARNPGSNVGWHYYYLYGLERAGAMTGLKWFGKNDWYREGAAFLLKEQGPDGGWADPPGAENSKFQVRTTQTCFALLFLRRATVPPAQPIGPVVTSGN